LSDVKEVLLSVRVEEELRDDLKALAEANDRNFSAELRRALRLYVLAEKGKVAA
jgi:predicted transcriptional regulator